MAITNLYGTYSYNTGGTNLPIAIRMDGWDGAAYTEITLRRLANAGFFAVGVGMRGRNSADGARDASGREIHDIYDALLYIRANFADIVSPTIAAIVGDSGGGGNALAAACKFPDTFSVVVDYFGMSDYGRDATYGWSQQSAYYRDAISTAVGGTPVAVPNNYYARDATAAIQNFSGGQLLIFHDAGDGTVPVSQGTRITDAMDAAGKTNYLADITDVGEEPIRYYPHGSQPDEATVYSENIFNPLIHSTPAWTIPASGTVTVIGYIVTKRFTIWLNGGLDATATVAYNTATDTYTVTPLTTAPINVSITQGAKTGSATGITEATQIVVA